MEPSAAGPGEEELQREDGGAYVFEVDDGFQVVFRPANRHLPLALFLAASLLILGFTLRLLLQEPEFNPLAWLIAFALDLALILALHIARKHATRGPLIVDGAEQRIVLQGGAEVGFDRLRSLHLDRAGARSELRIVHEEGVVRIGPRPEAELETAGAAVARLIGIPIGGEAP